jgi:hypothetical protein
MVNQFTIRIGGWTEMTSAGVEKGEHLFVVIFPFSVHFLVSDLPNLGGVATGKLVQAPQTPVEVVVISVPPAAANNSSVGGAVDPWELNVAERSHVCRCHSFKQLCHHHMKR